MATTYPYQTGTVFTEAGAEGNWQTEIMAPVTGATDTVTENMYGQVDSQGRVAVVYTSVARTASPTAYSLYTRGAQGLVVTIDMTAVTATGTVTFNIQSYDPASTKWVTLLSSAALAAVATTRLVVAPGIAVTANASASTVLGDTMRVQAVHGNAVAMTYTVGLDWM